MLTSVIYSGFFLIVFLIISFNIRLIENLVS